MSRLSVQPCSSQKIISTVLCFDLICLCTEMPSEQYSSISFKGNRTLYNLNCRLTVACSFNVNSKMLKQGLPELPFHRAPQVPILPLYWQVVALTVAGRVQGCSRAYVSEQVSACRHLSRVSKWAL